MSFSDHVDDRFHAVYKCYSVAFLFDHDKDKIENGGKILLPESALEQLIDHNGIMLFKLTNPKNSRLTHCGVLEFIQSEEQVCYLPYWMMKHLLIDDGDEIHVQSVDSLPVATFVLFQPQSKAFHDITNTTAVLENVLRNFNCLTKGDLISINYLNKNYELTVLDLKPSNVVSIIECDLNADFAPAIDEIQSKALEKEEQITKNSSTFMPFHGHGTRLNGKIKATDNGENRNLVPQRRGIPNYDYKCGLLQFPRIPLNSTDNDINNSSNTFQPFSGEGKNLRQKRNQ